MRKFMFLFAFTAIAMFAKSQTTGEQFTRCFTKTALCDNDGNQLGSYVEEKDCFIFNYEVNGNRYVKAITHQLEPVQLLLQISDAESGYAANNEHYQYINTRDEEDGEDGARVMFILYDNGILLEQLFDDDISTTNPQAGYIFYP